MLTQRQDSIKSGLNRNGNRRGMNPKSVSNLKPGKGRPKRELSLTNCAREKLLEPCPYAKDKTWLQYLVERWLGMAVENASYFRELMDRLEGKVVQPVGGEGGGPIEIIVKWDGNKRDGNGNETSGTPETSSS